MREPKFKNGKEMTNAIKGLSKKYGEAAIIWAFRKWDKKTSERNSLLKEKRCLEKRLQELN